jgi:hypothetical protein
VRELRLWPCCELRVCRTAAAAAENTLVLRSPGDASRTMDLGMLVRRLQASLRAPSRLHPKSVCLARRTLPKAPCLAVPRRAAALVPHAAGPLKQGTSGSRDPAENKRGSTLTVGPLLGTRDTSAPGISTVLLRELVCCLLALKCSAIIDVIPHRAAVHDRPLLPPLPVG